MIGDTKLWTVAVPQPNRFHRFMQRLCFGIIREKHI